MNNSKKILTAFEVGKFALAFSKDPNAGRITFRKWMEKLRFFFNYEIKTWIK